MTARIIAMMAKAPLPGVAKTRLAPAVGERRAAALQRAFLFDRFAKLRRVRDADVVLICPDAQQASVLRPICPADIEVLVQRGNGLMEGLEHALADLLARGYEAAALVDTDSPTLPAERFGEAFEALEAGADIVLGPCDDGGFYLLASGRPIPSLLTPNAPRQLVCLETVERARRRGLNVSLLPSWYDVDEAADLSKLADELCDHPERAPRSAAALITDFSSLPSEDTNTTGNGFEIAASRYVHDSPWRRVRHDTLVSAAGETSYLYLEVPRAVFVVPVTPAGQVVLVRQYRHPVRDWIWEVPAGSIERGEDSAAAAKRELAEEVGGYCIDMQLMASYYSSAAHTDLTGDYYLASDTRLSAREPAAGEISEVACIDIERALALARCGAIPEGQSALALLLAEPLLRARLHLSAF